jgi:hypothetical protein
MDPGCLKPLRPDADGSRGARGGNTLTRFGSLVVVLAIVFGVAACADGGDGDDVPRAAETPAPDPPAATQVEAPIEPSAPAANEQIALVATWAREATQAARNGPTVLLRFAVASRQPGLVDEPDCIPPFAGGLRDDPSALADPVVTRRPDGTYRVRGTKLSVDVAVDTGRVGHLDGCGGPAGLLADAEEEQREAAAAAAREVARKAAEEAAAREREAQARLAAEREAQAQADAEAAARQADPSGDAAPDDRVEVFPRDRIPPPSG